MRALRRPDGRRNAASGASRIAVHLPGMTSWILGALVAGGLAITASAAVYQCVDARGRVTYTTASCPGGEGDALSIDAVPTRPTRPAAGEPGTDPGAARRTLSRDEAMRIAELERRDAQSPEAVRGRALVIAAIRAGVDRELDPRERAERDAHLAQLASGDASARIEAERGLRRLYERRGLRLRARGIVPADILGESSRIAPGVPSTGPLSASPAGPLPAAPSAPRVFVDPLTGDVLAPAGDRLVDPVTGRIYMRAGRVFVDPATGRVLPAN